MNSRVACFTGRFQPFHLQHRDVVVAALSQFDRLIIGITNPDLTDLVPHEESSHRHSDAANPFDYQTRKEIIQASLPELESLEIIPFDLENPESWQVPKGTTFILRIFSPWEMSKKDLFENNGFTTYVLAKPEIKISASEVRDHLGSQNLAWQNSVSHTAIQTIELAWSNSRTKNAGVRV
ncbi:MAG: adenylyltransferase/cytidyltransferase family protein [Actinomycetes bacterium]